MTPHPHLQFLRRRQLLAAAASWPLAGLALAPWPRRPIRLLVGFPGGSTPDLAARVLADALRAALGATVVVDNRPGAAGNIAADQVAKARDDHTLGVVINGNLTSARLLNPRLPYDPARDFTLLSLLATAPLVLLGSARLPDAAGFFAAARAAGTGWNYGSAGIGTVGHLGMELIKRRAGFSALHVPYGSNPAVLAALGAGDIQTALVPPGLALGPVQAGQLRAIGLTGGRSVLAPLVPPLASLGVAADELEVWVALVGPAGLSAEARDRLAATLPAVLRGAEARQGLFNAGWQVQAGSAEVLRQRVQAETRILGDIIRQQGIRIE